MREAVQLGAAAVEVVDVADIVLDSVRSARARGTNRAIEAQKGAIFIVASVGKEINVPSGEVLIFKQERSLVRTGLPIYT
jgi:hypothetical protein